jgi:hypothetical protein
MSLRDDVQAIVDYNWEDEKRDYEDCEDEDNRWETNSRVGHIFETLQRLRKWLEAGGK